MNRAKLEKQSKRITRLQYSTQQIFNHVFTCRLLIYRDAISGHANVYFNDNLEFMDCSGALKIDHAARTLSVEIKASSSQADSEATSEAKSLSGGERSLQCNCYRSSPSSSCLLLFADHLLPVQWFLQLGKA